MRISACRNSIACLLAHFEIPSAVSFLAAPVRFSRKSPQVSTSVTVEKIGGAGDTFMVRTWADVADTGRMIADRTGLNRMGLHENLLGLHQQSRRDIYTARRTGGSLIRVPGGDD